jgi:hypothetical protein
MTRKTLLDMLHITSPQAGAVDYENLSVYQRFTTSLPDIPGITTEQDEEFLAMATTTLDSSYVPALLWLVDYQDHIHALATEDAGLWKLPG